MVNAQNVSSQQLRRALELKEEIEILEQRLASTLGTSITVSILRRRGRTPGSGRSMSPAARARIAAAQRARWARGRSEITASTKDAAPIRQKGRRRMSAAAKARIAAAARKRWAAYRASKG